MLFRIAVFALLGSAAAWAGQSALCEPAANIRAELEKATLPIASAEAFEQSITPLQALRSRNLGDIFVHERYQDAVQQYGIEGHLRQLTEEYQALTFEHPGELMYGYLFVRSMVGRNTPSAIERLNEILAKNPDFAPAHRALAEIYASTTFHDSAKEQIEQEKFLSACPGSRRTRRPAPLPDPSPLIERAEHELAQNGDPEAVAKMALEGLRADEWRLQRIRPHDWYSVEDKRQSQRELQSEYWRVWSLQVRCYRKANQAEKAAELLRLMEQRASLLRARSDPGYSDALAILARLHAEGGQDAQSPSPR